MLKDLEWSKVRAAVKAVAVQAARRRWHWPLRPCRDQFFYVDLAHIFMQVKIGIPSDWETVVIRIQRRGEEMAVHIRSVDELLHEIWLAIHAWPGHEAYGQLFHCSYS